MTQVVMPQMGESIAEGTVVKWLKQPGDDVGRDEPLQLAFQPLLALVVLTVRAVAMAAGMRNQFLVIAVLALDLHHRARRTAATANRRNRPQLLEAQPVAKLRHEVGFEFANDGREADHRGAFRARE